MDTVRYVLGGGRASSLGMSVPTLIITGAKSSNLCQLILHHLSFSKDKETFFVVVKSNAKLRSMNFKLIIVVLYFLFWI
jgi:hypothetical protein